MFKKLRNTFLKTNAFIIALLIIICFTIIYIIVSSNVHSTISERLQAEISLNMTPSAHNEKREKPGGDSAPNDLPEAGKRDAEPPSGPSKNSASGSAEDGTAPDGAYETSPDSADGNTSPDGAGENAAPDGAGENAAPNSADENAAPNSADEPVGLSSDSTFSPSFSIQTDSDGNVTKVNIVNGVAYTFYEGRTQEFIEKENGVLKLTADDGTSSQWSYMVRGTNGGYVIAFTETSMETSVLRTLLICLILISLISMAAVLFISYFIANRAIAPIEQSYNKQKQFIADASHELKTPLTTINANIDVLLSHENATIGEEKKWLIYIQDEAKRMSALTNSLLYLAKADYDEENVVYSQISLTGVIKNILLLTEARIYESGQILSSDIDDDIYVLGSDEKLKQLVLILLDNAIKYTPDNGKIAITLKRDAKSANAVMKIRNTGDGISDEDMKHIFDRFYRSDKARTHTEKSGFGLGLAIAQAITKGFKGSISVSSQLGEYTEFTVKLPLVKRHQRRSAA